MRYVNSMWALVTLALVGGGPATQACLAESEASFSASSAASYQSENQSQGEWGSQSAMQNGTSAAYSGGGPIATKDREYVPVPRDATKAAPVLWGATTVNNSAATDNSFAWGNGNTARHDTDVKVSTSTGSTPIPHAEIIYTGRKMSGSRLATRNTMTQKTAVRRGGQPM